MKTLDFSHVLPGTLAVCADETAMAMITRIVDALEQDGRVAVRDPIGAILSRRKSDTFLWDCRDMLVQRQINHGGDPEKIRNTFDDQKWSVYFDDGDPPEGATFVLKFNGKMSHDLFQEATAAEVERDALRAELEKEVALRTDLTAEVRRLRAQLAEVAALRDGQVNVGAWSAYFDLPANAGLPGRGVLVEWGDGRVSAGLDGGTFVPLPSGAGQTETQRLSGENLRLRRALALTRGKGTSSLAVARRLGAALGEARRLRARVAEMEASAAVMREELGRGIGDVWVPGCVAEDRGHKPEDCVDGCEDVKMRLCACGSSAPCDDLECSVGRALAHDAGRALLEELDLLRAQRAHETARLGADLRQARFVASGEASGVPAEALVRENHRLRARVAELESRQPVACGCMHQPWRSSRPLGTVKCPPNLGPGDALCPGDCACSGRGFVTCFDCGGTGALWSNPSP
jgi:hypothetical protein